MTNKEERMSETRVQSRARVVAEQIAEIPDHDCVDCGKPVRGITGHMASGSAEGWIHRHGLSPDACERAASVDHVLACEINRAHLMEIERWAWSAFTEDLSDEEWDALPASVREALTGIYVLAGDATSMATYEGLALPTREPATTGANQ